MMFNMVRVKTWRWELSSFSWVCLYVEGVGELVTTQAYDLVGPKLNC